MSSNTRFKHLYPCVVVVDTDEKEIVGAVVGGNLDVHVDVSSR